MKQPHSEPDEAHGPIQPGSERREGSRLGVVDTEKPVDLHGPVPRTPEHNDNGQGVQMQQRENDEYYEKKQGGRYETRAIPLEQCGVRINADEARQMMAHSDKCQKHGAINIEVDTRLGPQHYRNDPKRNQDEKGEVPPGTQNP